MFATHSELTLCFVKVSLEDLFREYVFSGALTLRQVTYSLTSLTILSKKISLWCSLQVL